LTFAENVTDLKVANREFKKFIQRLRYEEGEFRYLAVIEFQKRGAVHYHMMSDLFYISNHKLRRIWSGGFVKINRIKQVDNVGAYLVKYMCKADDIRLHKRKAYLRSYNLGYPVKLRGHQVTKLIIKNELKPNKIVYSNVYRGGAPDNQGFIDHQEFNLKQTPAGVKVRDENFTKKCEKLAGLK